MTFGLTELGFIKKDATQVRAEIESDFRAVFGNDVKVGPEHEGKSLARKLVGILADRESELWDLLEDLYINFFPDNALGVALDNAVSLIGIQRFQAAYSTSELTLGNVSLSPITILTGSITRQSSTNVQWVLTEDVLIGGAGGLLFTALDVANITWQIGSTIRYSFNGSPDLSTVVSGDQLIVTGTTNASNNGTFTITDVNNTSDYVDVTNTARSNATDNETGSPAVADIKDTEILATGQARSENKGNFSAVIGSINIIVTPLSGWNSVINLTVAIEGRDEETDSELRTRAGNSTVISTAGTSIAVENAISQVAGVQFVYVQENRTAVTDINGLPPHSFESIVLGGLDADIANAIKLSKPLGIETYGTETVPVTDSQGNSYNIKFSRITEVDIYLIVNLTVDGNYPVDGDNLVEQALVDYGEGLTNGEDVLNHRLVCALGEIPGILTVVILQGLSPSPTTSNNISIAATDRANIDATNIMVNS